MKIKLLKYLLIVVFVVSPFLFYFLYFGNFDDIQKTFLTVATFFFAVLSGFFIARQGTRYSDIRGKIADIDGNMSFIYRSSEHLGSVVQKKIGGTIKNHYKTILNHKSWDWYFMHKSKTLIALHDLLEKELKDQNLSSLKNVVMVQIMAAMREQQQLRKQLVALYQERIPKIQWVLLFALSIIILFNISLIPSQYMITLSSLKGIFVTALFAVLILLYQLDNLKLFEEIIGEHSAEDVIGIIEGEK